MKQWISPFALALAACGGATSPGSGSNTLYVEAIVEGKPDSTSFSVIVLRSGSNVVGANVFFVDQDSGTERNLVGHGDASKKKGDYRYEGQLGFYAPNLKLKITAGNDSLEALLAGPAPHVILKPDNNDIVAANTGEVLGVEWRRDGLADRVWIKPEGVPAIELMNDPGSYDVPLGPLKTGDQKLRVERENQVPLAGGTQGSVWKTSFGVENRFTLQR